MASPNSDPASAAKLAVQLKHAISLLEQLHIMAQTERLLLEQSDWAKLAPLVQAKEDLVAGIVETERQIAILLADTPASALNCDAEARGILESLKQRGTQLMDMIRQVDEENRNRLEILKTGQVEAAAILGQDQKLLAYSPAPAAIPRFSETL